MKTRIMESCMKTLRRRILNAGRRHHLDENPRRWSNAELRKVAPLFNGQVANVSGWRDEDKEHGHYRDYFSSATEYAITNYWGSAQANDGHPDSIPLDLTADLPAEFHQRFDVVFNHTVLEHIDDLEKAFGNLCAMTRDVAVVIVPYIQDIHFTEGLYGDCWRFTPHGLNFMFRRHGLELVYLTANDGIWYPIYLFAVASRKPAQWKGVLPEGLAVNQRLGHAMFHHQDEVW
jgi:hypothetical protein